jgi:hypothetical protein
MWSNISNIAANASQFLAELDETIDDGDEAYSSEEDKAVKKEPEDKEGGVEKGEPVMAAQPGEPGKSTTMSQIPTVDQVPVPTAGTAAGQDMIPPESGATSATTSSGSSSSAPGPSKQQHGEIQRLQKQLSELKDERAGIKEEVKSQLQSMSAEMSQSISTLAVAAAASSSNSSGSSSNSNSSNSSSGEDAQTLRQQLKEAETQLLVMSRAQTQHNQELEETIANLQAQVVEQRTYGNKKADEVAEARKELAHARQEALQQVEEKAVGEVSIHPSIIYLSIHLHFLSFFLPFFLPFVVVVSAC